MKHIPTLLCILPLLAPLARLRAAKSDTFDLDKRTSQGILLERMYPMCKVEKIRSVRGSTGCWWYKEENRVEEWVLKHAPDLPMIGGIS